MKRRMKASQRPRQLVAYRNRAGKRKPVAEPFNFAQPPRSHNGSLDRSLGYAIRRAQIRAYQMFADFMDDFKIRPAQFALLVFIHENPGVTQSVAGTALAIEKANLAGLLMEIHPRGVIERKSLAADRRAYSLHLTASGRKLVRKLLKRHERYEHALAHSLGPGDRQRLLLLLGKLLQKV